MKLALPVLAASASASTLLFPIYSQIASTLVNQVSNLLDVAQTVEPAASTPALASAIGNFNTALQGMDQTALVDAISTVDVTTLVDADGNFNTDALITIFTSLDPAVVQDVQDQFVASMAADPNFSAPINAAMTAFADLGTVFGQITNNEIEWSNFLALYNDFSDGFVNFNAAFGNNLSSAAFDSFLTYSQYLTIAAEKAMVVYESYDSLRIGYRNAFTLIEFGWEDRLTEGGHVAGNNLMCTIGNYGLFGSLIEMVDFVPDVLVTNLDVPVTATVNLWDDFVHGLPVVSDFTIGQANLDAFGDWIDATASTVSGSLTELSVLASPFASQINAAIINATC